MERIYSEGLVSDLCDEMSVLHLDTIGLAAALNVSEKELENWAKNKQTPPYRITDTLARAASAKDAESVTLGYSRFGRPITAPASKWKPTFTPFGMFRLPIHIDWSGSRDSRWRDAGNLDDLISAYSLVIDEGGVGDIINWVDPDFATRNWNKMTISRTCSAKWQAHFSNLGYALEVSDGFK